MLSSVKILLQQAAMETEFELLALQGAAFCGIYFLSD